MAAFDVIVVHYGDAAPTARCLDALASDAAIGEVILVDQPPTRFGDHARVTIRLATPRNVGFAAACNLGVTRAVSPFVLLLNNDAVLSAADAKRLGERLDALAEDDAGACLKLLCMDGATLQSAAGLWFTADGIGYPKGFGETDRGQYDALPRSAVGVPSGAAGVYRTRDWREVGGMSDEFFCYCEDGDLGLRLVAEGRSFAWFPDVAVRHELSASTGAHSQFKAFHVERNHFLAMLHAAPASRLAELPLLTLARLVRAAADAASGRGAAAGLAREGSLSDLSRTLLEAWSGAVAATPAAWAKRRAMLQRHPDGTRRVADFLRTRTVSHDEFARSRAIGTTAA